MLNKDFEDGLPITKEDYDEIIESKSQEIAKLKNEIAIFKEEEMVLKRKREKLQDEMAYAKATHNKVEASVSNGVLYLRTFVTFIIVFIFIAVDIKMLYEILYEFNQFITIDIFKMSEKQISIAKYIFLFLIFQLIIFSQGFGFSSIVKLIEAISNAIRGKKAVQVNEKND